MNIVIYFRKRKFMRDSWIMLLVAFIFGAISFPLAYFLKVYVAPILFGIFFFTAWPWLWRMFHAFILRKPALVISDIGIQFFPVHVPSHFVMSWAEIQKISVDEYNSEKCICVYPKHDKEYLLYLPLIKRIIIRLWHPKKQVLLNTALCYLDQPVIEICQQISQKYATELREHDVQLQLE